MWPDERVARFVTESFIPVRLNVREQPDDFKRFGDRYTAKWTPITLVLDPGGVERYRIEGFLPADDLLAQLTLGLGHLAFSADQWDEAIGRFEEVVNRYPRSEAAAEAQYWAGVSRYKKTDDATALRETARAFESRYSGSSWAKKASVWKQ